MIVVDGAYKHFPHEVPWSTDRTEEIAWCYGAEWIPCPLDGDGKPRPWHSQVEKRQAYLCGGQGDWYLVIDADVRLIGTLPELEDGKAYVFTSNDHRGGPVLVTQLFQHQGRVRYKGSHNALWIGDQLVNITTMPPEMMIMVLPSQCHFVHLAMVRDEDRLADKRLYYDHKRRIERSYRKAYSI